MALSAKLELRQGQQLVMTPQLQQAIRLLQLSNLELIEFVEAEIERNPLLERDDTLESGRDGPEAPEPEIADLAVAASNGDEEAWLDLERNDGTATAALDAEIDNVFLDTPAADLGGDPNGSGWASLNQRSHNFDVGDSSLEDFVPSERSLKDHLQLQLPLALVDPVERLIGQHLIDLVDDAGYLGSGIIEISDKLAAPLDLVERVLAVLQTFEPCGVFARSLGECLALQLQDQNRYDPMIAALLDNLHLLAAHNFAALRKAVGCDTDELTDMIEEIKKLNPKPGLIFGAAPVQTVVPDILVRAASDGNWLVELNSETLPRVLVNRSYYTLVSGGRHTEKDKNYLVDCLQTANWLAKSLDQRARTILRVAEEIVRQQDGFFAHGIQYLRPLNLKTVADAISMHESTVSRVTSNKYMATPRGLFELKYFFTSSIASSSDEGEAHSSEAVRHRIKQMIDSESARMILSDDKIVEKLKTDGVDIARRTVAKYREAMRIPSSVQRRREKRLVERSPT
jgi:RNA polymerase sigma-54 factor